jgi:hypothetical protein
MDIKEIGNMRVKQLLVTNVLIVLSLIVFFTLVRFVSISFSQVSMIVAFFLALQGIVRLLRGDTTKSLLPIFEKVAIYEKEKMGREWYKERKTNFIGSVLLGCLMFLQAFWNRSLPEQTFQMENYYLAILIFLTLALVNIGSVIRFRKIDRSLSKTDLKGYTQKSNVIGIGVGIIFAVIMGVITMHFILF